MYLHIIETEIKILTQPLPRNNQRHRQVPSRSTAQKLSLCTLTILKGSFYLLSECVVTRKLAVSGSGGTKIAFQVHRRRRRPESHFLAQLSLLKLKAETFLSLQAGTSF
jgi:hypothetical protein